MGRIEAKSRINVLARLLAAFALALGIGMCAQAATATAAYAAEDVTVALTVYDNTDDTLVYNGKVVGLTDENTVADLLGACGFTKIGSAAAYSGDPHEYFDSYGAPYFLGKESVEFPAGSGNWIWWTSMFEGVAESGSPYHAMLDSTLENGKHYQYVYGAAMDENWVATFSYTTGIPDPLTTEPNEFTQLLNGLAYRFGFGGADGELHNGTYDAALGLANLGKGYLVDVDSAMSNMASDSTMTAGRLAKYILITQAAGADPKAVSVNGSVANLFLQMQEKEDASVGFYDEVIILASYMNPNTGDSNELGMAIPSGITFNEDKLIDDIVAAQAESGLFPNSYPGAMETAEAVYALYTYATDTDVYAAMKKGIAAVMGSQAAGGSLPSAWGYAMDFDAMGEVLDAFGNWSVYDSEGIVDKAALGKMAGALASAADATLDGYKDAGTYDEAMTSASALRGLSAAVKYLGYGDYQRLDNVVDLTPSVAEPVDIADATIAAIADQTYKGKAIEPALSITYGGETLVAGTDYTAAYADNVQPGTATVTVTGKGGYKGTASATFKIVAQNTDVSFQDVPEGSWFHDWVYEAAKMGVVGGYEKTRFGAGDAIKRCDVAVIMYRYVFPDSTDTKVEADYAADTTGFADMDGGMYYTAAMNWAKAEGIFKGDGNGKTVRPNDTITREEMGLVLYRYAAANGADVSNVSGVAFNKAKDRTAVSGWARDALVWTAANNILSGKDIDGAKYLAPQDCTLREEAAKMLVQLFQTVL